MFEFLQPNFLYLFIPMLILVVFLYFKKSSIIQFSWFDDLKNIYKKNSFLYKLYYVLIWWIFIVSVVMMWQPVMKNTQQKIKKDGIDIMIALDVSLSMQADDLQPTRIEAAKNIIVEFLDEMVSHRVWLIVFSWKPFTSIPLNFDYDVSKKMVEKITTNILDQSVDGLGWTAIWDAIIFASDSFQADSNRQKVLILLTDGTANIWIDPQIATDFLMNKFPKETIKIYTIWLWWEQQAYINYTHPLWFTQRLAVEWVDEKSLQEIAQKGNGKYFRAQTTNGLNKIFEEISQLEKTPIETINYQTIEYINKYLVYLLVTLFLILLIVRLRIKN